MQGRAQGQDPRDDSVGAARGAQVQQQQREQQQLGPPGAPQPQQRPLMLGRLGFSPCSCSVASVPGSPAARAAQAPSSKPACCNSRLCCRSGTVQGVGTVRNLAGTEACRSSRAA